MKVIEFPPGYRCFEDGGLYMSFDPPNGETMPAVLFRRVDEKTIEVLKVEAFRTDDAALRWFKKECDVVLLHAGWLH